MQIVVDTNVILAMLVNPGKPIDLFFSSELEKFAPALLFKEIENNEKEILEKSRLNEEEFNWLLDILKLNINIVPEEEFLKYREHAQNICPDPKDIVYFALAIHLKCPIWTNEKKLKEQEEVQIYATHELIKKFEIS